MLSWNFISINISNNQYENNNSYKSRYIDNFPYLKIKNKIMKSFIFYHFFPLSLFSFYFLLSCAVNVISMSGSVITNLVQEIIKISLKGKQNSDTKATSLAYSERAVRTWYIYSFRLLNGALYIFIFLISLFMVNTIFFSFSFLFVSLCCF